MTSVIQSQREEIQKKILKKKPELIYRRNIQRLFECLNYLDTDVINNAVVLLPESIYDFLDDFGLKNKIIELWQERVRHVHYHNEEQMKTWFLDSLRAPHVQNIYQMAFGGDSTEKPILLIHVAFDQIAVYHQYQGEIRVILEDSGTREFLNYEDGKYPAIFTKLKDIIQEYKDIDILLNINGFSIIPKKQESDEQTEPEKEEEYLDDFDRTLMQEFAKNKRKKLEEEDKKGIFFAELQDHYRMKNFDMEQNYIFYRLMQKFVFEFFPYKEIVMNCFSKNPIHIGRSGYLVSHPEVQLCILDDWNVATIWFYSSDGKIIYHQGIIKDMSLFCNQLSDNLVDELRYLKKQNKEYEFSEKHEKLRRFMSRFTQALCIPDII